MKENLSDSWSGQIEKISKLLRKKGFRITPQRLEVFKSMLNRSDHPSAELVFLTVKKKLPRISRDTVYRALGWLEDNSFIFQVASVNGVARYDADLRPHFHFICENCGYLMDVFPEKFPELDFNCFMPEPAEISRIKIELSGYCKTCMPQKAN